MVKTVRLAGYCLLCKRLEIKRYGKVLNVADKRHERACKAAKCKHMAVYVLPVHAVGEQLAEHCRWDPARWARARLVEAEAWELLGRPEGERGALTDRDLDRLADQLTDLDRRELHWLYTGE
jgi:hypothetical protein